MGDIQTIHLIQNPNAQNWVLGENHPTQGRRFLYATETLEALAAEQAIELVSHPARVATKTELERVHTPEYVQQVLILERSGEWEGERIDLSQLAAEFAGGTLVALDQILAGAKLAVNLPGAKHHAQANRSSGFCVFGDFALAAKVLVKDHNLRVAILDIDAHHGDGTENLTRDDDAILTFSIHEGALFPYSAMNHEASESVHNRPLAAGAGDDELVVAVQDFIDTAKVFAPDVILVAAGGDGHLHDPLSSLQYSEAAFAHVGALLRNAFPETPFLVGGAGGYRPDDYTPAMWLHIILALAGHSENQISELNINNRISKVRAAHEAN
ncbi:MAG: hypothetical protein RL038_434 [Actinomycetota bacterium]|jgi:acetoin utilization protein AcuC